jgi:hypothetical protein
LDFHAADSYPASLERFPGSGVGSKGDTTLVEKKYFNDVVSMIKFGLFSKSSVDEVVSDDWSCVDFDKI